MSEKERGTAAPDGRPQADQPIWRQRFPIDVPQDQYVARRSFTKLVGLTSLAFVVGQFWIVLQSWLRRRKAPAPARALVRLDQVPVGGALSFGYPEEEDRCLLIRPDEQTLLAYDQKCTHLSCAVTPALDKGQIRCPCHRGVFDLNGRPIAGPPRRPLARITLEIRDGVVHATGMEHRTV